MIITNVKINKNKLTQILIIILSISTCWIVFYFYYQQVIKQGVGSDILWRVAESKYFLKGINPYQGEKDKEIDLGTPAAAYAPTSYILNIPFALLNNNYSIVLIYSIIDIFCLYASLSLIRKKLGLRYSAVDPVIILITLVSLINLDHIRYLNYGIISLFGLVLALKSISES